MFVMIYERRQRAKTAEKHKVLEAYMRAVDHMQLPGFVDECKMKRMFLLLLLVSDSLCAGNYSYLGTGTSLAVCQPDTCALLSEVAAMREELAAMTRRQSRLEQNLAAVMRKMATFKANLQSHKNPAEELWTSFEL